MSRRDAAIIYLFLDCGLRLAELAGLTVDDVDLRDRIIYVAGKGSTRSGPRRRAVRAGAKCAQALDRYLRERRRHPFTEQPQLWLGDRGRATLSADGIDAMLKRRGARVGIQIHPHMFRQTWASQFRADGGSEGDLMVLGGWRSRTMLDRYGATVAQERAQEAARRHSLGDHRPPERSREQAPLPTTSVSNAALRAATRAAPASYPDLAPLYVNRL